MQSFIKKSKKTSTSSKSNSFNSFNQSTNSFYHSNNNSNSTDSFLTSQIIKELDIDTTPTLSSTKDTNKYYPSIHKKTFHQDIVTHPIFKKYVYPDSKELFNKLYNTFTTNQDLQDDEKVKMEPIFQLSPSQSLRNFMSPYAPYRGLLVIHGTGVGKTCTGLTLEKI